MAPKSERTPSTREILEQTLTIAEDLIQKGRTKEALELVQQVNDVTEEALRKIALTSPGPQP
jgi:hypothetical protein